MRYFSRFVRLVSDCFGAAFVSMCFLRHFRSDESHQTVVFSRGAFRRDIPELASGNGLFIDIKGEWLKRCLQFALPGGWFEQLICLGYVEELRSAFPMTIASFRYFLRKRKTRVLFGGVDYFEVAIFCSRELYPEDTKFVAVFHENYAIDFVQNVTRALYRGLEQRFLFDELYAYGPPATEILAPFTSEETGPRRMVMPRLARMADDSDFTLRMKQVDETAFSKTVLLLAFAGAEYLAPICHTATLMQLAKLGAQRDALPIIKFKNSGAAKSSLRQAGHLKRHLEWVYEGSVEALVWRSGFTIVFNSISLYEALLGPTVVIIPAYLDALHDKNLLQETPESLGILVGELQTVVFASKPEDIWSLMSRMKASEIKSVVLRERGARKAVVARKFYLEDGNLFSAKHHVNAEDKLS